MRRKPKACLLSLVLIAPASLLWAAEARADIVVGAGVGVAVPISVKGYNAGLAVDGRFGYELSLGPAALAIEAAGGYTTMPADALEGTAAKITRLMGGARLSFGTLIVPFVAAHAGYGWLSQTGTDPTTGGAVDLSSRGFTMDAKIGFDIRPIHVFSIGANGGYNLLEGTQAATAGAGTLGASGSLNYLTFGVQMALAF